MTPELLKLPHASLPRNPLIAEPLFRIQYIEKAGTGTTDMIEDCLKAGLPEPKFEQSGPSFVVTIWRDWLTDQVIEQLDLSDREKVGVNILRLKGKLTSAQYQQETNVSRQTASRDFDNLVKKGVIERCGEKKSTFYVKRRSMPQI